MKDTKLGLAVTRDKPRWLVVIVLHLILIGMVLRDIIFTPVRLIDEIHSTIWAVYAFSRMDREQRERDD